MPLPVLPASHCLSPLPHILEIGVARSGVKGPLTYGSSVVRSNSNHLVIIFFRICIYFCIRAKIVFDAISQFRYFGTAGGLSNKHSFFHRSAKMEEVAPISAPILQMVPLPVALILISTFTKIFNNSTGTTFYGQIDRPLSGSHLWKRSSHSVYRLVLHRSVWAFSVPREACHYIHSICTTYSNGYHSQTTCITVCVNRFRSSYHRGKHSFPAPPGE